MLLSEIKRLNEIATTLSKYGFGFLLEQIQLPYFGQLKENNPDLPRGIRFRLVLQELGTTYIKLGQILSTRHDLFPRDVIQELQKLQDDIPPEDFSVFQEELKRCFGDPKQVFRRLDEKPLASASIGQVHYGELHNGKKVVIKIRRPHLYRKISRDLSLMRTVAELVERYYPKGKDYAPVEVVEEFEKSILRELKFDREGKNIERFRQHFQNDPHIHFPKVYWQYTNDEILTMEYLEGVKIDTVSTLTHMNGYRPKLIARRGAQALFKQIFEHGFFHADPHAGNVLIRHNNDLCFLDCGMVGYLNQDNLNFLADLIAAVIQKREQKVIDLLQDMELLPKGTPTNKFKKDLHELLVDYYGLPLSEMPLSGFLTDLLTITNKYRVSFPPHFLLLFKTILTIDGIGRQLDPNFNPLEEVRPYIRDLLWRRYRPQQLLQDGGTFALEILSLLRELPREIQTLVKKTNHDGIPINLNPMFVKKIDRTMDSASNRVTFGLVLAALLVSSSLVILAAQPPYLYGVPLLGIIGYTLSGLVSFILLILMLRRQIW